MNKDVLKQYLLNKEDLWQYIFTTMFLQEQGLLLSDLNEKPFKAVTCLKFCNTFGEQEELWNLAEAVDEYFEDIAQSLDLICQTKSVPWQYDFVEIISKLCTAILTFFDIALSNFSVCSLFIKPPTLVCLIFCVIFNFLVVKFIKIY